MTDNFTAAIQTITCNTYFFTSPKGNLLRLNKINYYDFKGQDFNDISHRNVTLELPPHKPKTAVFLDDKLL